MCIFVRCIHVCMCVQMCVGTHVYTCLWRPKVYIRNLPWSFFSLPTQVSDLNPKLTDPACLASHLALGISCFCFPSAGLTGNPPHPSGVYLSSRDLSSGPCTSCLCSKCFKRWAISPALKSTIVGRYTGCTHMTQIICLHEDINYWVFKVEILVFSASNLSDFWQ